MKKQKECCKNCRAGREFSTQYVVGLGEGAHLTYGFCCRNPPIVVGGNVFWGQFPPVKPTGWCDKWKPKTTAHGKIDPQKYLAADGPNDLRTVLDRLCDDIADTTHSMYNFELANILGTLLEKTKDE